MRADQRQVARAADQHLGGVEARARLGSEPREAVLTHIDESKPAEAKKSESKAAKAAAD